MTAKKILVIRNDRLGDFMLSWPAISLLKNALPDCEIMALVPDYTAPMAELCQWIDDVIIDEEKTGLTSALSLSAKIRQYRLDAVIDFHPETYTALAVYLSGISVRFSPASRVVQFLYNHRLVQRRSRSEKPEFEYNIDLAQFMLYHFSPDIAAESAGPPYLTIAEEQRANVRSQYSSEAQIDHNKKLIMIHPGSGGSAVNLRLNDYAALIRLLARDDSFHFIITAGPGEEQTARKLSERIQNCSHNVYISNEGLGKFATFISIADFFICGSTGVLHIAGALDVPTAAFYPSKRSATALRWQTINNPGKQLAFSSKSIKQQYIDVDINDCYEQIRAKLNGNDR